jgi:hypothetical protein
MSFQTERGDQGSRDTRAAPTAWRRPTSLFRTKRGIARTVHGDILPQKRHRLFHPRAGRAPPSPAKTIARNGL